MSSDPDPYRLIGELYDAEHDAFDEDIELLLSVTEELDGPILELGCGSARILRPLAEAGHRVTGIDSSPVMLERARRRLGTPDSSLSVDLIETDMRSSGAVPEDAFDLAIYSLNGLMHLSTQEDQLGSLATTHRSLRSHGMVFFDLMNSAPEYLERIADSTLLDWQGTLADGRRVLKWSHRDVDVHAQTIATSIWYDLTGEDGKLQRVHTGFTLRYVHLSELALMLNMTGFGPPSAYGSYELDPLSAHSERLIVTAEKLQ